MPYLSQHICLYACVHIEKQIVGPLVQTLSRIRELEHICVAAVAVFWGCIAPNTPKETYVYKQVGQCKIKADVYRLPGNDIRPALVWLHGGGLIMGDRDMLGAAATREQLRGYLNAGFVVVAIDYRLAPETKLPEIMNDIRDAYHWILDRGPTEFNIDPGRVALVGHSAGAYLALLGGVSLKPRPKAVVSFYGYGDIAAVWYTRPSEYYLKAKRVTREEAYASVGSSMISENPFPSRRERFYVYCRQTGLWPKEVAGFDPEKNAAELRALCPLWNITSDFPPTLLLHGDKDDDVPYEQSVLIAERLKQCGVAHRLVTMAGLGHAFDLTTRNNPKVNEAFDSTVTFLREHLKRM